MRWKVLGPASSTNSGRCSSTGAAGLLAGRGKVGIGDGGAGGVFPQRGGGGLKQHFETGALHHLGLVAVIEHREAGRYIGFERKLLQQARAQRVNGLHLQAARCFQRARKQLAG